MLVNHVTAAIADLQEAMRVLAGWDLRTVGAAVFGIGVLVARVGARRTWRRDPVRWFPAHMRATARTRAGGRCEYMWLGRRCRRPAQETDHFIPWARGGDTSQANAVAACRTHNQRKGARVPSLLDATGLWWRRRTYYPAGTPRWPGHRYRPVPRRPKRRSTR